MTYIVSVWLAALVLELLSVGGCYLVWCFLLRPKLAKFIYDQIAIYHRTRV